MDSNNTSISSHCRSCLLYPACLYSIINLPHMTFDSLLKILVPKDNSFFPLFQKDAQNLIKAAELLRALMYSENLAERESYIKQIKEVELAGDEISHSI